MTQATLPPYSAVPRRRLALEFPPWFETVLGFFYPTCCQICGVRRASVRSGFVCDDCRATVTPVTGPACRRCGLPFAGALTTEFECSNCLDREFAFDRARAAVIAEGVTLEVIHRYKYQQALWFEPFLGGLLIDAAAPHLAPADWDVLVPVPLHPVRQREREFNQAERLARCLSRAVGVPVDTRLVERSEMTRTQTHLSRDERLENVQRAFRPRPGARLRGPRCLVIDDVLTTGATSHGVARALRKLGASTVEVWSVARAVFKAELIGEEPPAVTSAS